MTNRLLFTLLLLLSTLSNILAQVESSYTNELFTFTVENGKNKLNGTLTIPANFNEKQPVIVFVSPPQSFDRNYGLLFSDLSDVFSRSGIATLRYDNRAFSDSTDLPRDMDKYSMFDIAADVHDAFVALRKDKRFSKSAIGLLGHSEGGAAAAIEASRNKNISFLVELSTMGIQGADLAFNQMMSSGEVMLNLLPTKERNQFVSLMYSTTHLIAACSNNKQLKKKLIQNSKFNYLSTPTNEIIKSYGKRTLQQVIEGDLNSWMKPRLINYMQFNPYLYYSKIGCPVLLVFGKKDDVLDWKTNLYGIERIFIENRKLNYTVIIKDSLNHTYETVRTEQPPIWMTRMKGYKENERGKGYKELCNSLVEWIKSRI